MSDKEEEKDMSTIANSPIKNRAKLWEKANKNTVKNSDGLTVVSKDSPYRKESGWESTIKG
ncbi:hypothetical protein PaeBR_22555 [Paenibacillus sp. BR2-3]|uniref:hypothetical protein n=1 Tax=Paenibacillus sp. BR2-3 TaxID=3048494 RepID=UPI00397797F8